jgi:hypothetical protein
MAVGGGATCQGNSQLQSSMPLMNNNIPIGWKATCNGSGGCASTFAFCCCSH